MLLLIVFVALTLFFTWVMVDSTKSQTGDGKVILWCMPFQLFTIIFGVICAVTPAKYGEIKLVDEYELASFMVNASDDVYAIYDRGIYTLCLQDDTNRHVTYNNSEVTSIIYIDEGEAPKVCRYVQQDEWTWYAAPMRDDKETYVLYLPKSGILYEVPGN